MTQCQEAIDVDLPDPDKRIIVNAILKFNENNPRRSVIKITETSSFFENNIPSTLDNLQILNQTSGGVGFYIPNPDNPSEFIPGADGIPNDQQFVTDIPDDFSDRLVLTFEINRELYLAEYRYSNAPEITSIVQENDNSLNEGEIKITLKFTDIPDQDNYYIFDFGKGELLALEDQFFKDQEYEFSYVFKREINAGETIEVKMTGADRQLYNYYNLLIEQSELGDFGLFQTPAATARGNILKLENIDNIDLFNNVGRPQDFVLGYFALIREHSFLIEIQ